MLEYQLTKLLEVLLWNPLLGGAVLCCNCYADRRNQRRRRIAAFYDCTLGRSHVQNHSYMDL
ncbi:hypothetical protein TorRG33x02_022080, partial [Trema orientale]